jgi:hypothetical protein
MSGLVDSNAEAEQLDQTHAQHTRLKTPGAMQDQIQIAADFDASLDELFDGELAPAMFTKP